MSRTITPKYRLEIENDDGQYSNMAWNVRTNTHAGNGMPTRVNLLKWIASFEESTQPGGCNDHLGATHILWAQIVCQRTGDTVVDWERILIVA